MIKPFRSTYDLGTVVVNDAARADAWNVRTYSPENICPLDGMKPTPRLYVLDAIDGGMKTLLRP